jgi:hypothetical protein
VLMPSLQNRLFRPSFRNSKSAVKPFRDVQDSIRLSGIKTEPSPCVRSYGTKTAHCSSIHFVTPEPSPKCVGSFNDARILCSHAHAITGELTLLTVIPKSTVELSHDVMEYVGFLYGTKTKPSRVESSIGVSDRTSVLSWQECW